VPYLVGIGVHMLCDPVQNGFQPLVADGLEQVSAGEHVIAFDGKVRRCGQEHKLPPIAHAAQPVSQLIAHRIRQVNVQKCDVEIRALLHIVEEVHSEFIRNQLHRE